MGERRPATLCNGREVTLDAVRLGDLAFFSRAELREIAAAMIGDTVEVLGAIEAALAEPTVALREHSDELADLAHRGCNDALSVGAAELNAGFAALEAAARRGQLQLAELIVAQLQALWPPTREAIERMTASHPAG
jgi:hypothetical protein